jgi:hypothetical protein
MDIFIMWMGPIGAICIGIITLSLFFNVVGAIKGRFASAKFIKIKNLLTQPENVTVHLSSGKTVSDVRFIGFTDPASLKGVPYQLSNMVVFEASDGRRLLLRADAIRIIEEKKKTSEPAGGAYVAPAAGAPSAHP